MEVNLRKKTNQLNWKKLNQKREGGGNIHSKIIIFLSASHCRFGSSSSVLTLSVLFWIRRPFMEISAFCASSGLS
jgi:hypothetical protein